VQGGQGGSWFEVYCLRPDRSFPVGIIPWTWAELLLFFVHHFLGARPDPDGLLLRPRLLSGLDRVEARLPMHNGRIHLSVTRGAPEARVDGRPMPIENGSIRLPRVAGDVAVEFRLP